MNFPIELNIGEVQISLHLLFESLAFFIGFRYYLTLRKKQQDHISSPNRIWILIGAVFGAFLLSRLIGALENPLNWQATEHKLLYFFTNKTIAGGLLGGLLGVELAKLCIGEKQSSGDLFTPPIILAMIIGRIGCFSSGIKEETYGIETSLPWGINLGDSLLRHPTSLYEIIFLAILWLILAKLKNTIKLQEGIYFKIFMLTYFLYRFLIEYIKPSYVFEFGLTTIQITSIVVFIYYYRTIFIIISNPTKLLRHA